MSTRSKRNKNLTLTKSSRFRGLRVQINHGPLCIEYLDKIYDTVEKALDEHPRTLAIRIDLRFPKFDKVEYDGRVITDFIRSLESQVKAEQYRKQRERDRVHKCTIRYVWVKERNTALNEHYHLVLLFNKDRYNWLGKSKDKRNTLLSKIVDAWARTIDVTYEQANGLVYVSKDRDDKPVIHRINLNSANYSEQFNDLFEHVSYLAKEKTKVYGSRNKNFGASRR